MRKPKEFYYNLIPNTQNEFEIQRTKHIKGCIDLAYSKDFTHNEMLAVALHDIGYFKDYIMTGFHPIDGYSYLKHNNYGEELCLAVLYHTNAYDLCPESLKDFYKCEVVPWEGIYLYNAITYCDTRINGEGKLVTVDERYTDIENRYGKEHLASKVFRNNKEFYKRLEDSNIRTRIINGTQDLPEPPIAVQLAKQTIRVADEYSIYLSKLLNQPNNGVCLKDSEFKEMDIEIKQPTELNSIIQCDDGIK